MYKNINYDVIYKLEVPNSGKYSVKPRKVAKPQLFPQYFIMVPFEKGSNEVFSR